MAQCNTCVITTHGKTNTSVVEKIKKNLTILEVECVERSMKIFNTAILLWMNKISEESIIEELQSITTQNIKVIIINFNNNISDITKWKLFASGASDLLECDNELTVLKQVSAKLKRWATIDNIISSAVVADKIIGNSNRWKSFLRKVIEASYFTTTSILLTGESGTGKELTSELIHIVDQRKNKGELVLLDCTTISPELSGSEFYGHEKGAFTNAIYTREGAFALAHNGTLFLDELGDLPLSTQAGLLRVIQEKMYKRVGSNTWRNTNFRLVCATNRNLKNEITEGRFRQDLYFRIASAVFTLPSLSERREDIPELVRYFLRQELNLIVAPEIDTTVMNYLVNRNYPGNIRELKQLITRIVARYSGEGYITMGDIPEEELPDRNILQVVSSNNILNLQQSIRLAIASGKDLSCIKNDVANLAMEIALEDCGGNLKLAARKLNVEVRTLQYIRTRNKGAVA